MRYIADVLKEAIMEEFGVNIDLAGKRVALIGGAGFIGHNIALKLKQLGAEPHVIDSLQVNNLGAFTHHLNANPNDKLYVGFINERLDLLRQADIPLHIVDARDYHAAVAASRRRSSPTSSSSSPRSPTPTGRTRIPTAPSTTRCARWRTRSTRFATASRTSSSSRRPWSTATSRARR